jgi:hypothetical protein
MLADIGLQSPHASGNRQIRSLCPFHNERTPSFYVSIETGEFMCHSCLARGSFDTLVAHLCNTSATDIQSVFKSLSTVKKKKQIIKDDLYFRDIVRSIKIENPVHGFTLDNPRNSFDEIIESRNSKISKESIELFGLKVVDVKFKHGKSIGISIPLRACQTHELDILNGLQQIRVLSEEFKHQKYLNLVNTGNILYDYKSCIKQPRNMPIVVVEGVFDHIRLKEFFGDSIKSTCSFGARMTDQQLALCMLISDTIVISYDNDGDKFQKGCSPADKFFKYMSNINFSVLNPKKKIIRHSLQCKDFGSSSYEDVYTFMNFYNSL